MAIKRRDSVRHDRQREGNTMKGSVISVNISSDKGQKKHGIGAGLLLENHGLARDAHAGMEIRQVSLLATESIEKIRAKGLDAKPGDFAENITTTGIILHDLPLGTRLAVGGTVILELTQIGKECHDRCAIFRQVGDCVMPREGVFARVIMGGHVAEGDEIRVMG
jgi:MOSC domain-containing protein YiiM